MINFDGQVKITDKYVITSILQLSIRGRIKINVYSSGYHVDHILAIESKGNLAFKSWNCES